MRPDEAYLEGIRKQQQEDSSPGVVSSLTSLAKGAVGSFAGLGTVAALSPWLNEYLPIDLAIKGISHVSPKLGSFLKKGQKFGLDVKEGIDFIRNKVGEDKSNFVQREHPDLHQFMQQEMTSGRTPEEAAGLAYLQKRDQIDSLIKKFNKPWMTIVEEVYGKGRGSSTDKPQTNQGTAQQSQQAPPQQPQPEDVDEFAFLRDALNDAKKFMSRK